ncbi:20267_t:CDS:2, partial [Dentiscutata erythropus]
DDNVNGDNDDNVDGITPSRLRLFEQHLDRVTSSPDFDGQRLFTTLIQDINNELPEDQRFTTEEAQAALKKMEDVNK